MLRGHAVLVLWIIFTFEFAAAMSFARPFLLHPSPSCGEASAMAGRQRLDGKHIDPGLDSSSRESNESAATLVYAQSASASLEWLANSNGTNSVLPGRKNDASGSQSSRALSADGIATDATTCPVDKDGTLRFWGSGCVRWSECANVSAHIMAQSPIARMTANKMEAPVTVLPDLVTPGASAPVSTAYQWLSLDFSPPGGKPVFPSDLNVSSSEADVASGPLPSKSSFCCVPRPPSRPAMPPILDPRSPLAAGWQPMHGNPMHGSLPAGVIQLESQALEAAAMPRKEMTNQS